MNFKKADWLIIVFLLLISLFAIKALFHSGFYTNHDGEHQLIRLNHFLIGLRDGQFPVRWAGLPALDGYGYPLFVFTYRLPFYLGAFFSFIGLTLVDSIKAVFILSYVLSGVLMYWVQKRLWKDNLAALAGAVFYLWAPWRFSVIFVRASLGEAVCFLFFPLVVWSVFALQTKKEKRFLFLGAFSLACLLLSHAMLTALYLPFLLFQMGFCLWQSSKRKRLGFEYLKLLIISLGLSAFYWLPASVEKKDTVFAGILSGFYQQHFPTLKQLIYSAWGYGLSHVGTELDGMSFQVGIGQWLAVLLVSFLLIWQRKKRKKLTDSQRRLSFLIALFLIAVFLMTSLSKPYWALLSRFLDFDFPFRYLAITTLFSSFIIGGLITELKKDVIFKLFLYPVVLGLLFLVFYGNRNHLRVNQYTYFPDSYYENHPSSSSSYSEYRPRWVPKPQDLPPREEPILVGSGEAAIEIQGIRSQQQKFKIGVSEEKLFKLNTIYFPGWKLFVDGREKEIEVSPVTGIMRFTLPAGEHEVLFKFGRTGDRMIGEAISLCFFAFITYQLVGKKRKA